MWSNKSNNSLCSCPSKNSRAPSLKTCKAHKITLKKVIPSKQINSGSSENKSCSTSVVDVKKNPRRLKKITKSDVTVADKRQYKILDYCKNCGDVEKKAQDNSKDIDKLVTSMNAKSVRNDNKINQKKKTCEPIKQYYKNENFLTNTDSIQLHDPDDGKATKNSLDTIKEIPELHTSAQDLYMICSDSESEDNINFFDPDDYDNIEKLKEFRNKNYFECHSAKSRIKTRPNATSLKDHKCVYRFYLNDRLFPVPLNTDYNNKVRCVECHLPMDVKQNSNDEVINGTIQAKVKLGKDTKDMVLLLPIKESLIIEERRKEKKFDDKYVYFGVVKLTTDGNSIFNRTLPQDSLALKYQKGYKELKFDDRYKYKNIEENDIIVI